MQWASFALGFSFGILATIASYFAGRASVRWFPPKGSR